MVARGSRSARRIITSLAGGLLTLGLLAGCSVDDVFSFGWPRGVTPEAHKMFDLWIGSAIAALAVGFFVWGLIFWCIIRYRKRGEELPPQTRYNVPIEIVYTVMPFLVVSVLFYYTAVVQTDVTRVGNADMTVAVQAAKWNWKFSYPGTQGPDGQPVSTVGDSDYIPVLVVPTNTRIQFDVQSVDVIHSFWVPDLLFKRDVFPGNLDNKFETTILSEGAYVGRCAELCGTYHYGMNFEVRAVSPEKFQQWLEAKEAGASTPDALRAIGEAPYAVTTFPFETDRKAA